MGRELRRKEERKNKTTKKLEQEEKLDTSIKGITILKVVSAIALILVVVYYVLAVFVTKEIDISENDTTASETSTTSNTENTIANAIVAANIFNQKEQVYYVYCYDFKNEDEGVAQSINNASNKTIYRLDTSSGLNSKYVEKEKETGNKDATNLDNLKVINPTLLEITNDKITGYHEGRNSIMTYLSE